VIYCLNAQESPPTPCPYVNEGQGGVITPIWIGDFSNRGNYPYLNWRFQLEEQGPQVIYGEIKVHDTYVYVCMCVCIQCVRVSEADNILWHRIVS